MISDDSRRALFGAISVSLLLHLIVVFGWHWPENIPVVVPQQAIHLVVSARSAATGEKQPSEKSVAAPESRPDARKKHVLPPEKKPQPAEHEAVIAVPQQQRDPAPALPAAPETLPAASIPVDPTLPAGLSGSASGKPASSLAGESRSAAKAAEGVSADSLRQYRIALAGAALRFRHYPALARARGWEGVAEVTVVITSATPAPSLKLAKSSGHQLLDEQAMEMLGRAIARVALPEDLRGKNLQVAMPIRFSLDD